LKLVLESSIMHIDCTESMLVPAGELCIFQDYPFVRPDIDSIHHVRERPHIGVYVE
jgi:hypothetical protein